MKEKIILTPGCNGTELLRSLAKEGINTIGLRIMGASELARTALMHSGVSVEEKFLPPKEEAPVVDSFVRKIDYFCAATYADSEQLAAALKAMRMLIVSNEADTVHQKLARGKFSEKNAAISEAYDRYMDFLKSERLMDSISLIRKAIAETNSDTFDGEFMILSEYPLSILETELIKRVSGDNFKEISLISLFGKKASEITEAPATLTKAYGASNEVEAILSYIYFNNIPLDSCIVAVTETNSYAQLFYDMSLLYNVPMTFGCGVPILNSNPAKLFKAYVFWMTDGYYGVSALTDMLINEAVDRKKLKQALGNEQLSGKKLNEALQMAGKLRISVNAEANAEAISTFERKINSTLPEEEKEKKLEQLALVKILAKELEAPAEEFIAKYARIREGQQGRVDHSGVKVVAEALVSYFSHLTREDNDADALETITHEILKKTVCTENSREGCLYVTNIQGALAGIRKNLFIAGLSADVFPGAPTENYLLLDCDYELFGDGTVAVPSSAEKIHRKKRTYQDLRRLADALNVSVHLSYADYDLSELKDKNLSSVVTEKVTEIVGFFEKDISASRGIGRSYTEGKEILFKMPEKKEIEAACGLDTEYSPTAIDQFFNCPRKFMLGYVLKIKEDEEDKPFEVINAADLGTLVHTVMEYKAEAESSGNKLPLDDFIAKGKEVFAGFLAEKKPLLQDTVSDEEETMLRILTNAYNQDPCNEVLTAEEMKHVKHECGIKLKGIPDRVERLPDGKNIIADFKTGSNIKHKENDVETCLQVLVYAYIMEKSGTPISGCEYRYVRNPQVIPCRYDDEMKKELEKRLEIFKNALEKADFPCTDVEDNCKFCKFKSICGKPKKKDEDGGEG